MQILAAQVAIPHILGADGVLAGQARGGSTERDEQSQPCHHGRP
jgi:hypothetical protein